MEGQIHNGSSSAATSLSAAERLRRKHEADSAHQPAVEDVQDEDDLQHPPPSAKISSQLPATSVPSVSEVPSAKAMGKQKVSKDGTQYTQPAKAREPPPLDPHSEQSFPALGSGTKTPSSTGKSTWGAKKPPAMAPDANGLNGMHANPSISSSRASTPSSGVLTPSSSATAHTRGNAVPQPMPMPGKHSERIQFAPSQLLPRNQLKKSLKDTVRDINRKSKANVEIRTAPNGHVIFEGRGPVDATRQALKDLAREVGSKQQVKVPVPINVRPHIIGRQGVVIQGIQSRTGARVQLPRGEDDGPKAFAEEDDGRTIDVSVEGDAVAAEMARREIEAIINERTSTVNLRVREVPAEFLPFIAGPYNSRIKALEESRPIRVQVPHYHTWSEQAPPEPVPSGMFPQFVASPHAHIKISGDRLAAMEARNLIEREAEALRKRLTLSQVPIDKGRHQFILKDENSLHEFLQETGCAIVLPPSHIDTELLTITGPPQNIEMGIDRLTDLASSMQMSRIDIARQHANAAGGSQAHARALTRYLQHRKLIEQLEQQHNAKIVLPSNDQGSPDWEVYTSDGKSGIRAKQEILRLINAHPPSRIRHVPMDPFFHSFAHQLGAEKLRQEMGVRVLTPTPTEPSEHLVLIFEGPQSSPNEAPPIPREAPTRQEVAEFERSLQLAQQHLLELIAGQEELGMAHVRAPSKYHDKVRRFVKRQQQDLPRRQVPVQVFLGPATALNGNAHPAFADENALQDQGGFVRGPADAVDNMAAQIATFIEAEQRDELERGHVTSFDFPQKHMSHLIGRKGENINKFRDEFDVDIQTKEGKVDVIGPKAKAELAKAKILALGKQLDSESTHIVKIHPKYHREIIGPKGSQVTKLQERYNVRIQFPRAADERPLADDASEVSEPVRSRRSQAADEVIVKGPSKGADAAREELLNFLQWTVDHSHIATISVSQKQLPQLIGAGGQEMENLRLETGAHIDVPGRDSVDSTGRVQIQLKGTKQQVAEAKKILEQKTKVFDSTVTRTLNVDRKYHKSLIGTGGSNLKNIVVAAGGSDDRRDLARTVRFPRADSDEEGIRVEGTQVLVDRVCEAIEAFVLQREGQVAQIIEVMPEKHRLLIGRGGESRRKLESDYNVEVNIPKVTEQGSARSRVRVTGQPADIEKVKARIQEMIQDRPEETIDIPRKYHHAIADNGQFFRRLRNEHKVTVDHGEHKPPRKANGGVSNGPEIANGSLSRLPLITDDLPPQDGESHTFRLICNEKGAGPCPTEDAEVGNIPWILKGSPEGIAAARAAVERALHAAERSQGADQAIGYLVLPDPTTYRFVIGSGGSKINEIRRQTGCRITVPKDQQPGSAIEIVGSKEGVEEARDIILDVVSSRGRRDSN